MLKIHNFSKYYANKVILKDVTFQVEKGTVVALIGPSGAGKTTILKCINFLEKAEHGVINFNSQVIDVTTAKKKEINLLRKQVSFIFQNYNLFSNKTVLQNVTEGLIIARKTPKIQAIDFAKECLMQVGLHDKYDAYPNQLSGGQQQRVGIARAIAVKPDLLLLDEPTSSLDPEFTVEILEILQTLANLGTTMLMATHEMSFVKKIANKVIFVDQGSIIEQGTAQQIFHDSNNERVKKFLQKIMY